MFKRFLSAAAFAFVSNQASGACPLSARSGHPGRHEFVDPAKPRLSPRILAMVMGKSRTRTPVA